MHDENKPLSSSEEYAILLLKPDGTEKGMLPEILRIISKYGLEEVRRRTFHLSYHEARDIFIHSHKLFTDYITRDKVTAVLLYGKNAVHKLRLLKPKIRKHFQCDEVENLIHSPDSGMEFLIQSKVFFPDIPISGIPPYADFYAKVSFPDEDTKFVNKMKQLQQKVKAAAFVLPNFRYNDLQDRLMAFAKSDESTLHITLALEYYTIYKDYEFKVVAYYPLGTQISNYHEHCKPFYPYIKELTALIRASGGLPLIAPTDHLFGYKSEYYDALKQEGLFGAMIYHPAYSLKETAFLLEEIMGKGHGYLISGGSCGITPFGQIGVSYELFEGIYRQLYDKKPLLTEWITTDIDTL